MLPPYEMYTPTEETTYPNKNTCTCIIIIIRNKIHVQSHSQFRVIILEGVVEGVYYIIWVSLLKFLRQTFQYTTRFLRPLLGSSHMHKCIHDVDSLLSVLTLSLSRPIHYVRLKMQVNHLQEQLSSFDGFKEVHDVKMGLPDLQMYKIFYSTIKACLRSHSRRPSAQVCEPVCRNLTFIKFVVGASSWWWHY